MAEEPSIYTLLYWLIQDKKIKPCIFFNFLEFFWPTFVPYKDYVFLKENFSEEKVKDLIKREQQVEYWSNLLTIDDFFSELDDWEEKSEALAKALVEIWKVKLKKDFPNKNFIVEYIYDKEVGDYGLTFYQLNNKNNS